MQVNFKNTGMIEAADIRFNGLTVIAGENDMGKSTVGKLMFSIIKTFNRFERDAHKFRAGKIKDFLESSYFRFSKNHDDTGLLESVQSFFDRLLELIVSRTGGMSTNENIEAAITREIDSFTESARGKYGKEIDLGDIAGTLKALAAEEPAKNQIFRRAFDNYSRSIMGGEVRNKFAGDDGFEISGKDGKSTVFEITGGHGSTDLKLSKKLYFQDATFIESPMVLNITDAIRSSKTEFDGNGDTKLQVQLLEKHFAPEYMRDLILKLTERAYQDVTTAALKKIADMTGGEFVYDQKERDFVFKKAGQSFSNLSIAAGVKYLGMIGLLLQNGFLDKRSLLILDEPEIHLHPIWQVSLAKIVVELVKEGRHVLLTSHSPYFIEALKVYIDIEKLDKKAAFYLSRKKENSRSAVIKSITHDLSPVFELLAQPFRHLEKIHAKDTVYTTGSILTK